MDSMDSYAQPLEQEIAAKSENWLARQLHGIAGGVKEVAGDALRDIGNSYQAILTQDAGWHAQWNARGMHPAIGAASGEGDTTVYVGIARHDTTVYVGLAEDIGQRQEAAAINKAMEPGLDKRPEPEIHI